MKLVAKTALLLCTAAGVSLSQQASARGQSPQSPKPVLPAEMIPPPGMCRIWIRDLPAKQQPAPTDCATATRTKPANAYLYYGDDYAKKAPSKPPTTTVAAPGGAAKTLVSPQSAKPPVTIKPPIKPPGG